MKVLVLGASGMAGNAVLRVLSEKEDWEVFGTVRSGAAKKFFTPKIAKRLLVGVDIENHDSLVNIFGQICPDVVINCIGITKHLIGSGDPLSVILINSLLPHRLARLCTLVGARLVHISTDCVFSGKKGNYTEDDFSDAGDLYGKSKFLGEVNYPNALTLRTSIIGHELQSAYGLNNWFLSQGEQCKGYTRAIFSGVPTVFFAQLVRDVVIPRPDLFGVYHVAGPPISKYDLLQLIAKVYGKSIKILPDDQLVIDRSLNADRFCAVTGCSVPDWPQLVEIMHSFQ